MNDSASPPPMPPQAPPPLVGGLHGKQWAMFLHLSQLLGYIMPGLGFAGPLIIWLVLKDQLPELDAHGKMVTNWMISLLLYSGLAFVLAMISCGVGALLFIPLILVGIIFPIVGAIRANEGVVWKYPVTIPFIS